VSFIRFLRRLAYTVVRLIRFLFLHLEKLIGEVVPDAGRLLNLLGRYKSDVGKELRQ